MFLSSIKDMTKNFTYIIYFYILWKKAPVHWELKLFNTKIKWILFL